MHTYLRRALQTSLFAGGFVIAGVAAAWADDGAPQPVAEVSTAGMQESTPPAQDLNVGVGNGNGRGLSIDISVALPINISGNSVSLIGSSSASSSNTAPVEVATAEPATADSQDEVTNTGIANGNLDSPVAAIPVTAPISVSGNSVTLVGDSSTTSTNTAPVDVSTSEEATASTDEADSAAATAAAAPADKPNTGIANGNLSDVSLQLPITVPINISGNSVALIGDASTSSTNTAPVQVTAAEPATAGSQGEAINTGIANGNLDNLAAVVPVTAPINVTGNSVALIGDSATNSANTAPVAVTVGAQPVTAPTSTVNTGLADGNPNGTLLRLPITLPINLSGNAVTVIGDANTDSTSSAPVDVTTPPNGSDGNDGTDGNDGNDGVAGGNGTDGGSYTPGSTQVQPVSGSSTAPVSNDAAPAYQDEPLAYTGADLGSLAWIVLALLLGGFAFRIVGRTTQRRNG